MAVRTRSLVLLLLALGSGTAAAWLSLGYLRRETEPILNPTATAGTGVVAVRDMPVGTVITEQDVRAVDWPGNAVPPGLVTRPEQAVGRGVITAVRVNEPILEAKLAAQGVGGGLPILISEGMRALSIAVDQVVGVAGFVVPGTRVDVLLTLSGQGATEPTTKVLLQNIQALAAGQSIQVDEQGTPQPVPVVTLLVSPEQAETLTLAASQGRIQLTLRNLLDTLPITTEGARVSTLLGLRRPPRAPSPAFRRTETTTRSPAVEETIVEGFRGGERTLTRFSRDRNAPRDTTETP